MLEVYNCKQETNIGDISSRQIVTILSEELVVVALFVVVAFFVVCFVVSFVFKSYNHLTTVKIGLKTKHSKKPNNNNYF